MSNKWEKDSELDEKELSELQAEVTQPSILKEIKVRLKIVPGEELISEKTINSPEDAVEIMRKYLCDLDREMVIVVNCNEQNLPISFHVVSIGNIRQAHVPMVNIFKTAILTNSSSVMIFHNHPSGNLTPSLNDDLITASAAYLGNIMGIKVLDHVIVAPGTDDIYSYARDEGELIKEPRKLVDAYRIFDARENEAVYQAEKDSVKQAEEPKKKSMQDKVDEYRKSVAEKFLKLLDPDNPVNSMDWMKQWISIDEPESMTTGVKYRGINAFMLSMVAIEKGYKDPRWITFNGLSKYKGAKIIKGEKSSQIQFWMISDLTKKYGEPGKFITFKEAEELISKHGRDKNDFVPVVRLSNVFNAEQCTGLPELQIKNTVVNQNEYVTEIAKNMRVKIFNDGKGHAYYRPSTDDIHLPKKEMFFNEYAYNATALHELGHASGAAHRLNRTKGKMFGDEQYAFEELVAEMTSCFTVSRLTNDVETINSYIKDNSQNHMKYVKGWASAIENNPKCLEDAIKLAQTATDFLDLHGGCLSLDEYNKRQIDKQVEIVEGNYVMKELQKSNLILQSNTLSNTEEQTNGLSL